MFVGLNGKQGDSTRAILYRAAITGGGGGCSLPSFSSLSTLSPY